MFLLILQRRSKLSPTGRVDEAQLMDGTLWLTNFWFECLTAIPTIEGRAAMIKVSSKRFKLDKDVTKDDFAKPITQQLIVVQRATGSPTDDVCGIASVLVTALVGAGLGALTGPAGLVCVPLGFYVGMFLGINHASP